MSSGGAAQMHLWLSTTVAGCLTASLAVGQEIDPQADEILRAMSNYMSTLESFSVTADASTEILLRNGAKVQLTTTSELLLNREKGFRITRAGPAGNSIIAFDGTRVGVANEALGLHLVFPVEGSIDHALDETRKLLGVEVTGGADLLYASPYEGLMLEVEAGFYLGEVTLNGVHAHHLLYRATEIDWQIWIGSDGDPVPLKYVITSKWLAAAPSFSVQFRDFTAGVATEPENFVFIRPEGSQELDPLTAPGFDILGEG